MLKYVSDVYSIESSVVRYHKYLYCVTCRGTNIEGEALQGGMLRWNEYISLKTAIVKVGRSKSHT